MEWKEGVWKTAAFTLSQLHCFFMACKDSVVKCFELNSGPATEGPVCVGHFQFRRSFFFLHLWFSNCNCPPYFYNA